MVIGAVRSGVRTKTGYTQRVPTASIVSGAVEVAPRLTHACAMSSVCPARAVPVHDRRNCTNSARAGATMFCCNFLAHVEVAVCTPPVCDEMTAPAALYHVQSTRGVGPPPGSLRAHHATLSTSAGLMGMAAVPVPLSAIDMGEVVFAT